MVYIGSIVVFLFFIFTLYIRYDSNFCRFYVFVYLSIIMYAATKIFYSMFNKK